MNFDSDITAIASRVDFSALNNRSVLITGGSGFVGCWLQLGLQAAFKQGIKYSVCLLDTQAFKIWMQDDPVHYDFIFHLAPVFDRHVLHKLQDCNPHRIVYASSGAVYAKELNDYGRAKIDAENALMASGMDVRIARLFTFCAPFMRMDQKAVVNFVRNAMDGKPLFVAGDGSTVRSYMYGVDLAVWLWQIMLHGDYLSIYNVGSERPIEILKLAQTVREIINPDVPIEVLYDQKPEYFKRYVPDTGKTRYQLGVTEQYLIEHQICQLAEWMKEGE